jgi:hypothetical protein
MGATSVVIGCRNLPGFAKLLFATWTLPSRDLEIAQPVKVLYK